MCFTNCNASVCYFHIGIDGFSRLIVYLRCSNNNRAQTVLQYFHQAVTMLELPSRVRCDYGVENVDVGMYMLRNRGTGRGSVITGSSVHNQRVERMWRDVRRIVIRNYQNLFHYMEDAHLLDSLNEIHLVALHHVFMPVSIGHWMNSRLSTITIHSGQSRITHRISCFTFLNYVGMMYLSMVHQVLML